MSMLLTKHFDNFSDDENEEMKPTEVKEVISDYDLDFDSYQPIHDYKSTDTSSVMLITPKLSKVHLNDLQVGMCFYV